MFKKKAEKMKCQIGICKLNLVAPSQVILEVTEGGKVHNNYIKSVTMGTYDNMLCVESQNGVMFFLYENRQDRDEWYSTIRQLQHGNVPSFPTKRESLPAPPPVSTKPKGGQRKPVSSPSTLQQIFKQGLERDLNRILKRPQSNTGSGSYVNMDYNQALQDSKESYNTFNVLHGMQNMELDPAPSEDTTYDIPDEEMSPNLIEDDIYEDVDDGAGLIEEQIYDDAFDEEFTEDTFYDDTEMGAGAFGGRPPGLPRWSTGETPPPLPRRPNTMLSPQSFNETDDIYETVESDLPPPIPARPQPATNKQKIGGNPNGRVALRPMKQPKPKSTPIKPSKTTGKPMDVGRDGSRTHSTIGQSLGAELVRKVSQRNRSMTLPSGTGSHPHTVNSQDCGKGNTLSKKPMDLPSDIGKVQLRSPDRQMPKTRPSSDTDYPDELARKLAMRNSALSSDSTGSCLHGQTLHDQPTKSSWKQPQNHDNQLPKPFPKKKALVPPPTPTKPGKAQPRDQVDTKKHKSLPPTPARKPVQPPPSQELYEDTEIGPPAPKPKPKNTKRSPVVGRVPLDVRITRPAMQSLAGSVTFRDQSDFVVIERTDLPDDLHVGDQVLQIGDIDVRNSSAVFVTECWKRVSEKEVRVRILR